MRESLITILYLFELMLYVPINIFQSCWGISSVEPVLSRGLSPAERHNTVPSKTLELASPTLGAMYIKFCTIKKHNKGSDMYKCNRDCAEWMR